MSSLIGQPSRPHGSHCWRSDSYVETMPRQTNSCYIEFPVIVRNSYFITPKSRILNRYGTTKECSSILPVQYYFENSWIEINPTPLIVNSPQKLKPLTALTWQYKTPRSLATSRIYSERYRKITQSHHVSDRKTDRTVYHCPKLHKTKYFRKSGIITQSIRWRSVK